MGYKQNKNYLLYLQQMYISAYSRMILLRSLCMSYATNNK